MFEESVVAGSNISLAEQKEPFDIIVKWREVLDGTIKYRRPEALVRFKKSGLSVEFEKNNYGSLHRITFFDEAGKSIGSLNIDYFNKQNHAVSGYAVDYENQKGMYLDTRLYIVDVSLNKYNVNPQSWWEFYRKWMLFELKEFPLQN